MREGIARRVAEGWFPTAAPYGDRNVRRDGRGVVEVDPEDGPKVSRVFRLFARRSSERGGGRWTRSPNGRRRTA